MDRGVPETDASAKSEADHRALFPTDSPPRAPRSMCWIAEGQAVGHLWVAETEVRPGERGTFVFDVEVAEEFRRRGHGRSLMLLAEREAWQPGRG